MELTINIDEKKFSELLNNQLESFTDQELHGICRDALIKQLSDPDQFAHLFVDKKSSYGYSDRYYATEILKEAAKSVDLSPLFKDFQNQVLEYLTKNHDKIIKDLMTDIFVDGLSNHLYNSKFAQDMQVSFSNSLYQYQQQNEEKLNNAISQLR